MKPGRTDDLDEFGINRTPYGLHKSNGTSLKHLSNDIRLFPRYMGVCYGVKTEWPQYSGLRWKFGR